MNAAPLPSPIELVAMDEARNIRRRYCIAVDRDLFGFTLVETQWGRIGCRGQVAVHAFENQADALVFVRNKLRRRATATKRIGVSYIPLHPSNTQDSISKELEGF